MTVLHQHIGATSGGRGGDTSIARLGRWLPVHPSIPVSVSRAKRLCPAPVPTDLPADTRVKTLTSAGTFMLAGVHYKVDGRYGFQQVLVITDGAKITVADLEARSSSSTPGPHQA